MLNGDWTRKKSTIKWFSGLGAQGAAENQIMLFVTRLKLQSLEFKVLKAGWEDESPTCLGDDL